MALNDEATKLIRAAYKGHRKTVTIEDVSLKIRRVDHKVALRDLEGKIVTRIESWLVAGPAERFQFIPLYNIELTNNSRVGGNFGIQNPTARTLSTQGKKR